MTTIGSNIASANLYELAPAANKDVSSQHRATYPPILDKINYLCHTGIEFEITKGCSDNSTALACEKKISIRDKIETIRFDRHSSSSRFPPNEPPIDYLEKKTVRFATPLVQTAPNEPPVDYLEKKTVRFATPLVQTAPNEPPVDYLEKKTVRFATPLVQTAPREPTSK